MSPSKHGVVKPAAACAGVVFLREVKPQQIAMMDLPQTPCAAMKKWEDSPTPCEWVSIYHRPARGEPAMSIVDRNERRYIHTRIDVNLVADRCPAVTHADI